MGFLSILNFLLALISVGFVEPEYPPNAVSGGTVVAAVRVGAGSVQQISIQSGEEPFVGAAKTALSQWHFPADAKPAQLVLFHFRQPNLYYVGNPDETIRSSGRVPELAFPTNIVGPAFPAMATGQGSVILGIEIKADGSVGKIETLKSAGSFTNASIEAVRRWKFLPAEDGRGSGIASFAYVVCVYRIPVVEQKR